MKHRIFDAFDSIKADDKLKEDTLRYINAQRNKTRKKNKLSWRITVAAAATILILFVGVFTFRSYTTEAAYLDIDVNPSIELTINSYNRVIGTYAYNADGERVLAAVDLNNKTSEEAISILIDTMIEMGYIEQAGLLSATLQDSNGGANDERLATLRSYIDSLLQARGLTVEQEVFSVDSDIKTHSHNQNMTPAKYLAVLELQQVDSTVTFEACRNHSLGEIRQQTCMHEGSANHGGGNHGKSSQGEGNQSEGNQGNRGGSGGGRHRSSERNESSSNEDE